MRLHFMGKDFDRRTAHETSTDFLYQLLSYAHEFVSSLNEEQQRDVLRKSLQILTDVVGKKPRGWTAPAWSTSRETIKLLEEFGIVR
jgi:peptidoglycan/xylan/chitin deacetylase (PgdA/CDA1 family)